MLQMVKRQKLSEQTLLQKLTDYVERIDTDLVSPCCRYQAMTIYDMHVRRLAVISRMPHLLYDDT